MQACVWNCVYISAQYIDTTVSNHNKIRIER